MAFSMAEPTELEPACSFLTSRHIAALGFDPLVEWCFGLWDFAEAAVIGARARVSPSTPLQIPTHFDRCCTAATSHSRNQCFDVTAPPPVPHGIEWSVLGFVLNGRPDGVRVES